ncbi:ABC transporter permease [Aneurinibacillus uraniidurans]|uniref:ABC transporter permease n=1 Tax=Aneurinibacillus uraniidurans TaxID=2966586 RepID=UPI00234AEB82|nr:ABC transporter permease [Aneurinibacillus sp. B1]WCN37116.1 ABC transporter permease [Aneurinibacillus sp. B1]
MSRSHSKRFSLLRFKAIVRKEILQIRRDRASMVIAIMMPLMMLLIFGYAVNTDVDHLPTAVWDQAKTKDSRALLRNFTNTLYFDTQYTVEGYKDMQALMDTNKIKVGIVIPADYSYRLDMGQQTSIQIILDGSDPGAARTALANAQVIVQNRALDVQQDTLAAQGMGKIEPLITAETRVLYNPDMKSRVFNIPALIGLIMQNVTVILTAFSLVREKERGTLEQLMVTPIRSAELIIGKLVPYVFIGLFSFSIVLITGVAWFGVPVKGSILLLITLSLLFLITSLAIGILISTISKTQMQAMQLSFATILPAVLLSGFMFPLETMPTVLQLFSAVIPLTYFMDILRGIFLKAVTIQELWHQTAMLAGFATLFCFLAIIKFRKKID